MIDFFPTEGAEPPRPKADVRIVSLTAQPYPDGARVRMAVELTPFMDRPNLEIYARKLDGPIVAEVSVIETMTPNLEFTLHIRGIETFPGTYLLRAELFYDDRTNPQDAREITFVIDSSGDSATQP
jgi:hypothetical protein